MVEEYIRLTEHNGWERESWHFYIPLRGNEVAIRELMDAAEALYALRGRRMFKLLQLPVSAATVARRLAKNHCGYMHAHNKLEGRLDLRKLRSAIRVIDGMDYKLYKGEIKNMMRPWKRRPARSTWPTAEILAKLRATPIRDFPVSRKTWHHFGLSTWDARERLLEAGFKTAGEVADLTWTQVLALPGVGLATYHMVRGMLNRLELDLVEPVRVRKERERKEAEEYARIASSTPPEPQMTEQHYLDQYR